MDSGTDVDRGGLEEQPLSPDEKQLLSEYFQMEGRRKFEGYRTLRSLGGGSAGLFRMLNLPGPFMEELTDKTLSLELAQRDHWINLMRSVHERFFDRRPGRPEVMLWTLVSLEKHAIVEMETGKDEYGQLLRYAQQQQLPLIGRLGERRIRRMTRHLDLFYDLLEVDGLSQNLVGLY